MAVGSLEPQFFNLMRNLLGLDAESCMASSAQMDRKCWPEMRALLETTFASKSRDEWAGIFHHTDACVTPVFGMDEVMAHSHAQERGILWDRAERSETDDGSAEKEVKSASQLWEPVAAPRLSRTPASHPSDLKNPLLSGEHTEEILSELGISTDRIAKIVAAAEEGHQHRNLPF